MLVLHTLVNCKCLHLDQTKALLIAHWAISLVLAMAVPMSTIQIHSELHSSLHINSGPPQLPIGGYYFLFAGGETEAGRSILFSVCLDRLYHSSFTLASLSSEFLLLTDLQWCFFTVFPSCFVRQIYNFYRLFTLRL